jgi:hypothetical protein
MDAIAKFLRVAPAAVVATAMTGNNASSECHFVVRRPRVVVVANVDSSPQPYERLERTIVEDGQQFGEVREFTPPVTVPRLGLDAAWLPDQSKLMTTDGTSLVTVTVAWQGTMRARQLALARLTAERYLGKEHRSAADPNGT